MNSRLLTDKEQSLISQEYPSYWVIEYPRAVAQAQDAKTLQVVIDAINAYANKKISFERLAGLLEINFYELDAAFQRWSNEYRKTT